MHNSKITFTPCNYLTLCYCYYLLLKLCYYIMLCQNMDEVYDCRVASPGWEKSQCDFQKNRGSVVHHNYSNISNKVSYVFV